MLDPKEEEKETPTGDGQPKEKTQETGDGTPKTEVTKEKVYTPEEIKTLQKKAADFDGLIEKQRLAKLNKKEEAPKDDSEIQKRLEEINAKLANIEKEKVDNALTDAYKEFSTDMPWAIGDEYFDKISEDFSADGLTKKEELVSKLKALAISKFPDKYSEFEERKIKSKVLADAANINAGGGSGAGKNESGKGQEVADPLAKLKERFNSSLPKGFTATKK